MSSFDLQEQEQIDAMKAFWQRWGKWLFLLLVLGLIVYIAMKVWAYVEHERSLEVAQEYAKLETMLNKGQNDQAIQLIEQIQKNAPDSVYAARSGLFLAQIHFQNNNLEGAQTALKHVLSLKKNTSFNDLARVRLVMVLLDAKKYDEALKELEQPHDQAFEVLFLDLKGDVLMAKQDYAGARSAYESALAKNRQDTPLNTFIQMKLDALGSAS